MNRLLIFLTFVCFFGVQSCSNVKNKNALLNLEIYLPEELESISIKNNRINDSVSVEMVSNNSVKIVSIVDADCPKCILDNLNKVDSLFSQFLPSDCMYFILNVKSADSLFVLNNFIPQIRSKANILWDNGYHFETKNNILSRDLNDRTFMLDGNNKIIAIGNPLIDPNVLETYKKLASK